MNGLDNVENWYWEIAFIPPLSVNALELGVEKHSLVPTGGTAFAWQTTNKF
jgi:hypothetical protein